MRERERERKREREREKERGKYTHQNFGKGYRWIAELRVILIFFFILYFLYFIQCICLTCYLTHFLLQICGTNKFSNS